MEHMTAASGKRAFDLGAGLGTRGVFALGAEGGELARMLSRSAASGGALAGADVLFHDGTTPAVGAWLARYYRLPASLFFLEEGGQVSVWLRDGEGKTLRAERFSAPERWDGPVGMWDQLVGADSSFAAHRAGSRLASGLVVSVLPEGGQKPLRMALERLGCEVLCREKPEVPLLKSDPSGFLLTVRTEQEEVRLCGRDAVSAAVEWCLRQGERGYTVPAFLKEKGARSV